MDERSPAANDPGASAVPPPPAGDVPAGGPAAPPPPSRSRRPLVVGAIAAVLVVVLGGAGAAFWMMRGTGEQLLRGVPEGADLAVTVYLDPSASQKVNLLRMASRFPDAGSEEQIREQIDEALDEIFREVGLTHEDLGRIGTQVVVWADFEGESPAARCWCTSRTRRRHRTRSTASWRPRATAARRPQRWSTTERP